MTIPAPDPVLDIDTWIATQPDLAPLHGGRVYWKYPDDLNTYPALRVYEVSPPVCQPGPTPLYDCRIAVEILGGADQDFVAVKTIASMLTAVLHALPVPLQLAHARILDADVTSAISSPDPDTGFPRIILDARLTATL